MRLSGPAQPRASQWKGKAGELSTRNEGNGGSDGLVIDLQLVADSPYESAYVVPISLGTEGSEFLVQVDTGSSDLWVTSTACTSALCSKVGGRKYDPSESLASGQIIRLQYAQGEAEGLVVWDTAQLGGYSITHQALIAASNVASEPLSPAFNGVLGLALPGNSLIAQRLPPTTTDQPDGASFSSNLFSITPLLTAPGARFLSLSLERPGSDRVPSALGIGRHVSVLVPDASKIEYAEVVPSGNAGTLWWQASVQAITVYLNGVRKPITLPTSSSGLRTPTAILDSGVPLIIATSTIANGIYGAIGVSPAEDGNYYIPCTTPINMTIQLDGRMEVPLHPLDLTYFPLNDATSDMCIGAIQTPAQFPGLVLNAADMILGVPFLRNTYTVMAFDPPSEDGTFPANSIDVNRLGQLRPRLGLLNLTNPAIAADEFHQVRILKQPIGKTPLSMHEHDSRGLSVGIIVLISLLGFFGLCFVLFGARWAYMKRKYSRERAAVGGQEISDGKNSSYIFNDVGYGLAPMKTQSSDPSEDELRQRRFEEYKRRRDMNSTYTDDTAITYVDSHYRESKGFGADEFGVLAHPGTPDTLCTPHSSTRGYLDPWSDTVDGRPAGPIDSVALLSPPPRSARRSDLSPRSIHSRTLSGGPGADSPLLGHARSASDSNQETKDYKDSVDIGIGERPHSMAGVGTASRSRRISTMSPARSPREEHPPGARRSSPLHSPVLVAPPAALVPSPEATLNNSRNDSRVSILGHDS